MLTDGLTSGRVLAGVWLLAEERDTPYDGSVETGNPLRERTSVRLALVTADLRLTSRLGVQFAASLPSITRSARVTASSGATTAFSETFRGLGDTSLIAWYRLPLSSMWNVTLNGGVSLPTGKTEAPRFRPDLDDGSLVPLSRLQRGSGTVDPLFGVSANRVIPGLLRPGVRVFLTTAARWPVAENSHGLRTGAVWEAGAGASREIRWERLVAIVRLGWLHREPDVFAGTPVLVGGGDWLYLSPAVAVQLGAYTLQTEIKLPLYRSLDNRQLDSSRVVQFGIVRRF